MDQPKTKISFTVSKAKASGLTTINTFSAAPKHQLGTDAVSTPQPCKDVSPHESVVGSLKLSIPSSSPVRPENPKIRPPKTNSQDKDSHNMVEPPAKRVKRTDSSAMWERNSSRSNEVENKSRPTDASAREKRDEKDRHYTRDERHHRSRSRDRSRDRPEKRRERSRSRDIERERDREKVRDRDRNRERDRDRDAARKKSRSRERDGGRHKNGDRGDDRDKRDRKRSRSRERHRSRRGNQMSSLSIHAISVAKFAR